MKENDRILLTCDGNNDFGVTAYKVSSEPASQLPRVATRLTVDEAFGCIASYLYGDWPPQFTKPAPEYTTGEIVEVRCDLEGAWKVRRYAYTKEGNKGFHFVDSERSSWRHIRKLETS